MHTFPSELVNTKARRDAVLTYVSSHKAIGYLHWLAEQLFQGLCEYGEELTVIHKPCGIDVVLRREDGTEMSSANIPHHAWVLTTCKSLKIQDQRSLHSSEKAISQSLVMLSYTAVRGCELA
jgi:hypothetical protein